MSNTITAYGLQQARARLSHIATQAVAGHCSLITRYGKVVAVVVPLGQWQVMPSREVRSSAFSSLRGSGRGLWPQCADSVAVELRKKWS